MDLDINQLQVSVGDRALVDALSLTMQAGQLWCILGKNGAGKSTLLRTLAGLRTLSQGQVLLAGRPLSSWSIRELARMRAFLPQQQVDAFSSSVLDTVLASRYPYHLGLSARFGLESPEDQHAAHWALSLLSIESLKHQDVTELSGGERRQVALASMFAQQVDVLLLDEPAAHLDVDVAQRVFAVLGAEAKRGRTVAVSVHEPNLAARFATHVLQLLPGGRWLCGPVESLDAASLSETFQHPMVAFQSELGVRFLPV